MRITGDILALDLGISTGVTRGYPGAVPVTSAVRLKKPSEPIDIAYGNLIAFLCSAFERPPELLVKEKMLALQAFAAIGNAEKTVRAHGAYHGIVEGMCVRFGVPWMDVAVATARKHFIGTAHRGSREETKHAVIDRCHVLKLLPPDCKDDNQADSVAIHDWACATLGGRAASISNFQLFGGGEKKRA